MKMKAITKRIIAVIIAVLMLASLIPATSVFAAKDKFKQTSIYSVHVSGITAPKIGASIDTTGVVETEHCSIVKINWFDLSTMSKVTSFKGNKQYRMSVEVKADSGYVILQNATYKINGNTATETYRTSDNTQVVFIFDYPKLGSDVISSVKATDITAPKIGASIDTTATISTSNCSLVKVNWFNTKNMTKVDKFEEGNVYRVSVEVKANNGYTFDKNATYTINGKSAKESYRTSDDSQVVFILTYSALEKAAETSSKATSSKTQTADKSTTSKQDKVDETSSEEVIDETSAEETESVTAPIESSEIKTNNNDGGFNLLLLIIPAVLIICTTAIVITLIVTRKKK